MFPDASDLFSHPGIVPVFFHEENHITAVWFPLDDKPAPILPQMLLYPLENGEAQQLSHILVRHLPVQFRGNGKAHADELLSLCLYPHLLKMAVQIPALILRVDLLEHRLHIILLFLPVFHGTVRAQHFFSPQNGLFQLLLPHRLQKVVHRLIADRLFHIVKFLIAA